MGKILNRLLHCHSREGGNPDLFIEWIPDQVGDDRNEIATSLTAFVPRNDISVFLTP